MNKTLRQALDSGDTFLAWATFAQAKKCHSPIRAAIERAQKTPSTNQPFLSPVFQGREPFKWNKQPKYEDFCGTRESEKGQEPRAVFSTAKGPVLFTAGEFSALDLCAPARRAKRRALQ